MRPVHDHLPGSDHQMHDSSNHVQWMNQRDDLTSETSGIPAFKGSHDAICASDDRFRAVIADFAASAVRLVHLMNAG
jgi:hypothetical protein